jgi:hypothetical protein
MEALVRHPAHRDLLKWLLAHKSQAVSRLLRSEMSEDRSYLIGQAKAFERLYNEIIRKVAEKKGLEK